MHVKKMLAIGSITAAMMLSHSPSAVAGDVTNAVLSCYVDTYALDQLKPGLCSAVWTPSTANDPTIAHFEVTGLTTGNYSFVWTDLETNTNPGCGNFHVCEVPIATDVSGDGLARLSVVITDTGTGATKTVSALARYLDGWH